MKDIFEISGGTVAGREHSRCGKNNQDAFYWSSDQEAIIAVVCDGCSLEKKSEVGAKLGAQLIVETARRHYEIFAERPINLLVEESVYPFWEKILQDVLIQIRVLANAMGNNLSSIIYDYFLFAMVGVLITKISTVVFSMGDGVVFVNGEFKQFGPFPDNEPPYLGYGLTGSSLAAKNPDLLKFQVSWLMPTDQVQSILIGTDGVLDLIKAGDKKIPGQEALTGSISQFWQEDRYFRNPDMIHRRLALINRDYVKPLWPERRFHREPGLLPDDTTLVVIRRQLVNS